MRCVWHDDVGGSEPHRHRGLDLRGPGVVVFTVDDEQWQSGGREFGDSIRFGAFLGGTVTVTLEVVVEFAAFVTVRV